MIVDTAVPVWENPTTTGTSEEEVASIDESDNAVSEPEIARLANEENLAFTAILFSGRIPNEDKQRGRCVSGLLYPSAPIVVATLRLITFDYSQASSLREVYFSIYALLLVFPWTFHYVWLNPRLRERFSILYGIRGWKFVTLYHALWLQGGFAAISLANLHQDNTDDGYFHGSDFSICSLISVVVVVVYYVMASLGGSFGSKLPSFLTMQYIVTIQVCAECIGLFKLFGDGNEIKMVCFLLMSVASSGSPLVC